MTWKSQVSYPLIFSYSTASTYGQTDQSEISDGLRHDCGLCWWVLEVFAVPRGW